MLYYRYRSGSELCIKELIYDEMFFATPEECNDPYEGKIFAEFPADEECWTNLIKVVAGSVSENLQKRLVDFFVSISPISVGEVLKISEDFILQLTQGGQEILALNYVVAKLKDYITCYMPAEKYFVCFSKSPDNYLMWSHYANNHKGYCLIFRSVDGYIRQCPKRIRKSISYDTPKAFAPHMSFGIEEKFRMEDVIYVEEPPIIDAFMCFPYAVNGNKYSEDVLAAYRKEFDNVYYCKHSVWKYEQETRIVLSSGIPWLAGGKTSLSLHKRLFHYDSTQLVGIVLGAGMTGEQRNRIKEIIKEKIDSWHDGSRENKVIYDFVIFEEKLSEMKRQITIEPIEICGMIDIKRGNPKFDEKYEEWKQGYAIQYEGHSGKRIIVP